MSTKSIGHSIAVPETSPFPIENRPPSTKSVKKTTTFN